MEKAVVLHGESELGGEKKDEMWKIGDTERIVQKC